MSGVVGTLIGGCTHDRFDTLRALVAQLTALIIMMGLLPLKQGSIPVKFVALVIWGFADAGLCSPVSEGCCTSQLSPPTLLSSA